MRVFGWVVQIGTGKLARWVMDEEHFELSDDPTEAYAFCIQDHADHVAQGVTGASVVALVAQEVV